MEYLGTNKPINSIQPKVSVCITTYNHEAFIAECLDSVLMQETDFPFEIILGEDDSNDATREICKQYAEKYPDKIRLFLRHAKDKIFINGRKTGRFNFMENLKAARGDYIALCDGDDYWLLKDKLQMQYEFLYNDDSLAMCLSSWNSEVQIYTEKQNIEIDRVLKKTGEFELTFGHTSSIFFKKNCFKIKPYLYKTIVGDRHLVNIITELGDCAFLTPPLSYYRRHSGGVFRGLNNKERLNSYYYDLNILKKEGIIDKTYFLEKKIKIYLKYKYPITIKIISSVKSALKALNNAHVIKCI